jgi:hypothetical protein
MGEAVGRFLPSAGEANADGDVERGRERPPVARVCDPVGAGHAGSRSLYAAGGEAVAPGRVGQEACGNQR